MVKRKDSEEAEKCLIGSLLMAPVMVMEACKDRGVTETAFAEGKGCRSIWNAVVEMVKENKKIDPITVTEFMDAKGTLLNAGGSQFVTETFCVVPTEANYQSYLDIVLKNSAIREAKYELATIGKALDKCMDTEEVMKTLSSTFTTPMALCQPATTDDQDRNLIIEYVDSLESLSKGGGNNKVISTPLETINEKAGGTSEGEVTGIIGLPSSGKSILGKQFLAHALVNHHLPCMCLTGEMPYQQWMNRLVCELGQIDFRSIRSGQMNAGEQASLMRTIGTISKLPLYVYDRKRIAFNKDAIEAAIRREIKQHGVKFILLDYLQLVEVKGGKKDTRTDQDIGAVSKMLKEVAIQHGLHVVALCAESDDGKIRNSREPEYDFDNILKLIVRNEKNPRTGNPMIVTDKVLCSKWRDAERGYTIRVEMEGKHCLFRDVTGPNA